MSRFRTSRTRLVATAATTVLAALSLTACNDGTGTKDEGAAATAATSTGSTTGSTSTGSTGGSTSTGSTGGSTSTGSTGGSTSTGSTGGSATGSSSGSKTGTHASAPKAPASSGRPVTCEGSNTKTVAAPLTRPVNHMLLTVTNTGSRTCYLYGYPAVRFTGSQAVPPVIEDSQPQAVVTLEPGQSGYASIGLSATDGSGESGYTAKSLTVYFFGRSMSGNVGAAAHPPLPAKGVYIDASLKVTYWQQSMADAVNW